MNGGNYLIDTNIVIRFLSGDAAIADETKVKA